jgi:hypothetical protein
VSGSGLRLLKDACSHEVIRIPEHRPLADSRFGRYGLLGSENIGAVVIGECGPSLQNPLVFAGDSLDVFDLGDVTGVRDIFVVLTTVRHGAFDYLLKPFEREQSLHAVGRALEHRRFKLAHRAYVSNLESQVATLTGQVRVRKVRGHRGGQHHKVE